MSRNASLVSSVNLLSRGLVGIAFSLLISSLSTSCISGGFTFDDPETTGGGPSGGDVGDGDGDGDLVQSGGTGSGGDGTGGMGGTDSVGDQCKNERRDGDETDIDCGGTCAPCDVGRDCVENEDCENDSCIDGTCLAASCKDDERNFDETDVDCGGKNCGATCKTGENCEKGADCEDQVCTDGTCAPPVCDDRKRNGNETGIDCGGGCKGCDVGAACLIDDDCFSPDGKGAVTAKCTDGTCELLCLDDSADCNGTAEDGCEVDLLTDGNHCGACDDECDPDHAVGVCVGGSCLIKTDEPNQGCDDNYANCNLDAEDGCEAHLPSDPLHCSGCGLACSENNGTPGCSEGSCTIECDENFSDCDQDPRSNGCEINTDVNTKHCGQCDHLCEPTSSLFSAFCQEGQCDETQCSNNEGDCDGDGTCSDDLDTVSDCGGCGIECAVAHGTPTCQTSGSVRCEVASCQSSSSETWANCDAQYQNGCEVEVESNNMRCGGCLPGDANPGSGVNCVAKEGSQHVTAAACASGGCAVVGCESGWDDCNGVFENGCDTHLLSDEEHCGSCTIDCTTAVGSDSITDVSCSMGNCSVSECSPNRADCDGGFENGCETNTTSSASHCGGCNDDASNPGSGTDCTASIGVNHVGAVTCEASMCEVVSCSASNRADCDGNFQNGCETNTNDDEDNCGGCAGSGGKVCGDRTNASGACESGSCVYECNSGWLDANGDKNDASGSDGCESRDLSLVNAGTFAQSSGPLDFPHVLETSSGNQRLVLVGVLCRGNSANDCQLTTKTYGSVPLLTLIHGYVVGNDAYVSLYYLLDSALPGPGSHDVELTSSSGSALLAEVIELSGAEQSGFVADQGGGGSTNQCNNTSPDATVSLTSLPSGSLIYAVGGGYGFQSTTTDALSPLTDSIQSKTQNSLLFGSGIDESASGNVSVSMEMKGCDRSVLYAVGIRPEANY